MIAEAAEAAVTVVPTAAGWRVTILHAPITWAAPDSSSCRLVVGPLMYARESVASSILPGSVRLGANHQPAPAGRMCKAVAAMRSTEVLEALLEGCSTEEKDGDVSLVPCSAHAGSSTRTWKRRLQGKTALIEAAEVRNVEAAKILLAAGASVTATDQARVSFVRASSLAWPAILVWPSESPLQWGQTPLNRASMYDAADIVELLLSDRRVDPNSRSIVRMSATSNSCLQCHVFSAPCTDKAYTAHSCRPLRQRGCSTSSSCRSAC